MSMLSYLRQTSALPPSIHLLYSNRFSQPRESILFFSRLRKIFSSLDISKNKLILFHTSQQGSLASDTANRLQAAPRVNPMETNESMSSGNKPNGNRRLENEPIDCYRRMTQDDLLAAVGPIEERNEVVAYVCGPPAMTDWAVATLRGLGGMRPDSVLCEKWW